MPTVPKADLPGQRVSPLRPARASPGVFAEQGQQLQQLGGAVQGAADNVGQVLIKQQEKKNLDDVFRAETALKQWELEYGSWLRDQQGLSARGVTGTAAKEWGSKIQEISRTLVNEPQQRAFARIAEQRRQSGLETASRHEQVERDRSVLSAGEASADLGVQAIIQDPSSADVNIEGITKTYRALGAHFGESQAEVDKKIQAKVTAAHKGVIAAAVDTNPAFARKHYNKYKDQITPSERVKIEEQLREGDLKGFSQRKATELIAKHGDDAEAAVAEARASIKDPDRQEATVAQIKTRRNERLAFEQEEQTKAMGAFENLVMSPEGAKLATYEDVPLELRSKMSDSQKATVREYFRKKASESTTDDWDKIAEAEQLIERGANGGITQPQQLALYQPHMTNSQFNRLQTKLRNAKEVPSADVLKAFEDRLGKTRSKFNKNESDRELWLNFQEYATERAKKGENITDIANQFFMGVYDAESVKPRWWTSTTYGQALAEGRGRLVIDNPESLGPLDRPAALGVQQIGLPVSIVNVEAYRVLSREGYEVTPENVQRIADQLAGDR